MNHNSSSHPHNLGSPSNNQSQPPSSSGNFTTLLHTVIQTPTMNNQIQEDFSHNYSTKPSSSQHQSQKINHYQPLLSPNSGTVQNPKTYKLPSPLHQQQFSPAAQNTSSPATNHIKVPRFFVYNESEVSDGVNTCQKSILGKIITDKQIHVNSLQSGLATIWGSPSRFSIQETDDKILQFFMDNQLDQERILQGNPWIFRNSWLLLQPWDIISDPKSYNFVLVPVWIQLWGLPLHCKTKAMGKSIGGLLGNVTESELYEYPGKKVIVKIRVNMSLPPCNLGEFRFSPL